MSEIHMPFVKGEHAEADTKLLPEGTLSLAQNVRFAKDARVVSRHGYSLVDDAPVDFAVASAAWAPDRTLLFYERDDGPSRFRELLPDGTYSAALVSSAGTTIEAPTRRVAAQRAQYTIASCDNAYANGYVLCVYDDYDVTAAGDAGSGALQYAVYERSTMRLVASETIVDYSVTLVSHYFNPKCIALGNDIMIVYRKDNQMRLRVFHTATLLDDDYSLGVYSLAATGEPSEHQRSFDICPYDGTHIALGLEYIVTTTSQGIKAYTVTNVGAVSEFISTTGFGTQPKRVGIAKISDGNFLVSAIDGAGLTRIASYTNAGVLVVAITTVDSTGNARGSPCSGTSALKGAYLCWARVGSPAGKMVIWTYVGLAGTTVPSVFPVSKPFTSPDGGDLVWAVDRTESDNVETFGTYKLIDCAAASRDVGAGGVVCESVAAQQQALCGAAYPYGPALTQQRHVVTILVDGSKNEYATLVTLPILVGVATWPSRADFVENHFGEFVDSCHEARLNGQMFFSGARLREFDGSQLYESGLAQGPGAINISTAAGSITAGDRFYKVIWKWIDAAGRIHRSQPSTEEELVTVGATTNTLTIEPPLCTARTANDRVTIFAEIYRTIHNGTDYFLVNPFVRPTFGATAGILDPLVYADDALDADISANEALYTEGDILDNEEPPPCRYVVAGDDRLLLTGLEDPSEYCFSKRVTAGLAMAFSTDVSFRGTVDGNIVGAGYLDGVFYVGTRDAIYAVTGDGPDDLGDGQFTRPRRLPSDCGFMGQRSIVEVPQGLLFQGANGRLYLLPRGGGAPQWVGQSVRDVTDAYPLISFARFVPEQNIAMFCCLDHDALSTDAVLLVFDTRIGEWVRDVWLPSASGHTRLFFCAAVRNGAFLFNGNIEETTAYSDSGDGNQNEIEMSLITGDIRPFGAEGDGRVRSITVLGERGTNANITIDVSRDSAATWDTPAGAWVAEPLTDIRYDIPRARGTSFRIRIRSVPNVESLIVPGQNVILNALTLEVFQAPGAKRLGVDRKR